MHSDSLKTTTFFRQLPAQRIITQLLMPIKKCQYADLMLYQLYIDTLESGKRQGCNQEF